MASGFSCSGDESSQLVDPEFGLNGRLCLCSEIGWKVPTVLVGGFEFYRSFRRARFLSLIEDLELVSGPPVYRH